VTAPAEDRADGTRVKRSTPYQGLVPYSEADTEWFFGRDEWREIVVDSLRCGVQKLGPPANSTFPELRPKLLLHAQAIT
jgi:hypothetical protein